MGQYSNYLTQVRLLLHDSSGNGWSNATLTSYINEARRRIAKDTYCLRDLFTGFTLTQGVERYVPAAVVSPLPSYAGAVASIVSIDLYYGNSRYPLTYMPWRMFSLKLRYWQNLQQLPVAWSKVGSNVFYVGPIPDQGYTIDLDVAYTPVDLTSDAQAEVLPVNYTDLVQWWAARLAKTNEQSLGEMKFFESQYLGQLGIETAGFDRFQYAPRG